MKKRLIPKWIILSVMILSLLMSSSLSALAENIEIDDITLGEIEDEESDTGEAVPEMLYEPSEELFEEAEEDQKEGARAEDNEDYDIADVIIEDEETLIEVSDSDDSSMEIVDESMELLEDMEEVLSEGSDIDAIAESDIEADDELPQLDYDEAINDIAVESTDVTEDLDEEELLTEQDPESVPQSLDADGYPLWSLSIPSSQAIAYKAEKTKIGTISVKEASNFTDGQAICVRLDYSSFNSDTYSIPIEITVIQNGSERTWRAGTTISLSPDGSDPIEVFVNISAEEWAAAPHGAYAMSLIFNSALSGR